MRAGISKVETPDGPVSNRKTIAKYLAPAIEESLTPGRDHVTEPEWAAHIARWFPEITDPGLRAST